MIGDQVHFLSLAAILFFATVNTLLLRHKYESEEGKIFWLWGMAALAISCLAFGVSPYTGKVVLAIANFSLLASYLALTLQVRFWKNGRHNIPPGMIIFILIYPVLVESTRYFELPYVYRAAVVHGTMTLLTSYLLWSTIQISQRKPSRPLIMLGLTFLVECACALTRTVIPFLDIDSTTVNWFTEDSWMVVARWIWATTNAITYLAIMLYQLERTTNKKENLESLIAEKDQLLRATSLFSRANHASLQTGSIMHELRQPLSTILLGSTSLRKTLLHHLESPSTKDSLARYAEIIERESMRSMAIMNRLEQVYAPNRQSFQRLFLPELVESTLALLEIRIQNNQIKIEKLYQSSGEVSGDALQLESVITNLVSNAIKALEQTPNPRVIRITVKEHEGQLILEVRDNGLGIDQSVLPHIFSLFVSESKGGIGIGLWLSRIIMENHGGDIECKNMPGGGASFMISIPSWDPTDTKRKSPGD